MRKWFLFILYSCILIFTLSSCQTTQKNNLKVDSKKEISDNIIISKDNHSSNAIENIPQVANLIPQNELAITDSATKNNTPPDLKIMNTIPLHEKIPSQPIIKNAEIPVLMYHSITSEEGNAIRVTKENFQLQMSYLKDKGYTTLSLSELYNILENNQKAPEKPIVITFDDGYSDNFDSAYPILKSYNFKATIFMITNAVDNGTDFLTSPQLKELHENNIDIESHTLNHEKLNELSIEEQIITLKESKVFLENLLKKQVKFFAFPFSLWNDNTLKCLTELGYSMAFTTDNGWSNKTNGIFTLKRVFVSGTHDLDVFVDRISNPDYE